MPNPTGPGMAEGQRTLDRRLLEVESRQSMVAVIFIGWRFIRNLGVVNLGLAAVFLLSGRLPAELFLVGILGSVVGLVFMVLAWWRFTFVIDGDQLLVNKGVIAEERLTIPLDRVQSVSIDQRFLHRIVDLVSVSVDTAGSSTAEFEIDAIDRAKAEALQRLVSDHRNDSSAGSVDAAAGAPPTISEPRERELLRRTPSQLVRIGASRWPWAGLVALAPLFAVAEDLADFLPFDALDDELVGDRVPSELGARLVGVVLAAAIAVIVVGAVLGIVLQVMREVITNWDMKLIQTENGFRRTSGLLSRTSKASTINRIQAIQTDQTPVQRLLGIRKLTLPTIGEGDLDIPGASVDEVDGLRSIVFDRPGCRPPPLDRMISRLSVFLDVRNTAVFTIPITVVLVIRFGWWALVALAWIPLQWVVARRRWQLRRWSISPWRIAESYELLNRHTAELDLIKAQTVTVSQSFFERRRGLATVRVDTAEGHLAVPLISHAESMAVRDRALYVVESDRRSWM